MSKRKISNQKLVIQLGRDESVFALCEKGTQFVHSIVLPTPAGAVEDGMIRNTEEVIELIRMATAMPEFKGVYNTTFCLCTSQVITETVATPNLSRSKLEKLIIANMDMYFPVDMSEYKVVWQPIGETRDGNNMKELQVHLWAVPSAMLSRYYAVGNAAGLSVTAIDYCGNSVASAVGASFAMPGKAAAKERKKLDLNKEITFGRKKKAEAEAEAEPEAPAAAAPVAVADPSAGVETQLHLTMEKDLVGLTFVQNKQVVHQRFIQGGSNPAYLFDDVAMMVEYFRSLDYGRNAEITAFASGALCEDAALLLDLSDVLDMPVSVLESGFDPKFALCAGAARCKMDFGIREMNKPNKELTQKSLQVGQTAALAAGGAALAGVVALTFVARFSWNATIESLESKRQTLALQAQKVAGYADKYKEYTTLYDNYSSDWNTVFNSLRTYNDNLVRVLDELESILPEKSSVTALSIGADGLNVQFACQNKEEAAYLIMQLRELQYADLYAISSLSGGGRGPAKTYGNGEKAPTEGSVELTTEQRNQLASLIISDLGIYNMTADTSKLSADEILAVEAAYGEMPSTDIVWDDDGNVSTPVVTFQCTTLEALENYYSTQLNPGQTISDAMRAGAMTALLDTNPFSATRFSKEIYELKQLGTGALTSGYSITYLTDLLKLYNTNSLDKSTPENTKNAMAALLSVVTKSNEHITNTEKLIKGDATLQQWYVYYLQEEINKSVDIRPDEDEEEAKLVNAEYLDMETIQADLLADKAFSTSSTDLNTKLYNLLGSNTTALLDQLMASTPTATPPVTTPPVVSPSTTPPIVIPTPPVTPTPTPTPAVNPFEEMGISAEEVNKQIDKYITTGKTDYAPLLDTQINKYITDGASDYPALDTALNTYVEDGRADAYFKAAAAEYLETGSATNKIIDAAIKDYMTNGTTKNASINKVIERYTTEDELFRDLAMDYINTGSSGYTYLDNLLNKYFTTPTSGVPYVDKMISSTIDSIVDALGDNKNAVIYTLVKNYQASGGKTCGYAAFDKLLHRYFNQSINSSGSKKLDDVIWQYLILNGNKNQVVDAVNKGTGTGGGTGQPVDTRIAFTVMLGYNADLMQAELERKGLSNDSKVEKLEVGN